MTPPLALLLLLAATAVLCLLPFLPALLELRRKSDAAPLEIIRDHDGNIRRFAAGLRQYLDSQGVLEPLAAGPCVQGQFADGTPYLLIDAGPEAAEIPYVLNDPPARRMVVVYRPLILPAGAVFQMDVFATGAIHGGEDSAYRATLSDREILLARGSTVYRWVHSEDQLLVEADSILYGRASAERLLRLGVGCQFERLHAARIEFGSLDSGPWMLDFREDPAFPTRTPLTLSEQAKTRQPGSTIDVAGRRTLVRGDLSIPPGSFFAGDLVVTGQLLIGEGACIEGSVKGYKAMVLARGAQIRGSVVSGGSIALGPGCQVTGPVIAEREITIEAGAQLGSADRPTTVCAPRLFIHAGVVAFGSVRAGRLGQVSGGLPAAVEHTGLRATEAEAAKP